MLEGLHLSLMRVWKIWHSLILGCGSISQIFSRTCLLGYQNKSVCTMTPVLAQMGINFADVWHSESQTPSAKCILTIIVCGSGYLFAVGLQKFWICTTIIIRHAEEVLTSATFRWHWQCTCMVDLFTQKRGMHWKARERVSTRDICPRDSAIQFPSSLN